MAIYTLATLQVGLAACLSADKMRLVSEQIGKGPASIDAMEGTPFPSSAESGLFQRGWFWGRVYVGSSVVTALFVRPDAPAHVGSHAVNWLGFQSSNNGANYSAFGIGYVISSASIVTDGTAPVVTKGQLLGALALAIIGSNPKETIDAHIDPASHNAVENKAIHEALDAASIADLARFADKTSTDPQTFAGDVEAPSFASIGDSSKFVFKDLGTVSNATLVKDKIATGESGAYKFWSATGNDARFVVILFNNDNTAIGGYLFIYNHQTYLFSNLSFNTATFGDFGQTLAIRVPISFANVTDINANLGGTPQYGVENSTLHIKGTFTPSSTIAAGTKLFSTNQTLDARMTHGSAINAGSTGSESFVGISIQTNGDVYCLGALTSGVVYSIAVTASM